MKILETSRLVMRHQEHNDLENLFALYNDPDVIQYIPDAPRTYDEARKELMWHMNGHPEHPELGLWATIHRETNSFIGRCGLLPWTLDGRKEVEVAYLISKAYWGQGLGTEAAHAVLDYAFEKLDLSRLICLVDKESVASIKVAEKSECDFNEKAKMKWDPFCSIQDTNDH